jgi:hypothetical protein
VPHGVRGGAVGPDPDRWTAPHSGPSTALTGDRPGSFPGCAQVRTKVHRKDYGWFMGLVYDPRGLPGVMTTRPGVTRVLRMVSEPTLAVSQARTGQLRRIRWHTGQGRGYVHMTRESSGRDTVWYVCC